jgi:WhiB family redox-sensing transcriptional regulator
MRSIPIPDFPGAPCQESPELFFPPDDAVHGFGPRIRAALKICEGCPYLDDCRAFALSAWPEHGIWGGLTPGRRYRMKRQLQGNAT